MGCTPRSPKGDRGPRPPAHFGNPHRAEKSPVGGKQAWRACVLPSNRPATGGFGPMWASAPTKTSVTSSLPNHRTRHERPLTRRGRAVRAPTAKTRLCAVASGAPASQTALTRSALSTVGTVAVWGVGADAKAPSPNASQSLPQRPLGVGGGFLFPFAVTAPPRSPGDCGPSPGRCGPGPRTPTWRARRRSPPRPSAARGRRRSPPSPPGG